MEPLCPYVGLVPYSAEDEKFFFGREKDIHLVVANMFASRLTLLYGASGVGKSSILNAGIFPQLRSRDDLLVVVFNSWQGDPIHGIKSAVAKAISGISNRNELPDESLSFADYLTKCAANSDRHLMLILDQFEEYFLYHSKDSGKGSFAAEFPGVVTRSELPISCLISIREDSLARLDRFEGSIPSLFDNYLRLEHLDSEAAKDAITKPLDRYNRLYVDSGKPIEIDPDLVEEVIKQVKTDGVVIGEFGRGRLRKSMDKDTPDREGRVETSYLQLVMQRLWEEEAESRSLKPSTLKRLGGAQKIIQTHLDGAMDSLSASERDMAARMFHFLVTPSGAKIAHNPADLAEFAELPETRVTPLLEKLSDQKIRVLRPVAPPEVDAGQGVRYGLGAARNQLAMTRFEIFHDALAPAILDWRIRYLRAQERAENENRLKKWGVIAAVAAFTLGVLLTVMSYRWNWFGARTIYLAAKNSNSMDVIDWLIDQKVIGNIVLDDVSSSGTKRALVALRFAYELDPNSPQTKECLERLLRESKIQTRPSKAQLEVLKNNMEILKEIHKEVPYPAIDAEARGLEGRVKRLIDSTTAVTILNKLEEQVDDPAVSDTTLLNGYQQVLGKYAIYVNSLKVRQKRDGIHALMTKFDEQLRAQKSDTVTLVQLLDSWKSYDLAQQRKCPEKIYAEKEIQTLEELLKTNASILADENFVTCRGVTDRVPQGITDRFAPGLVSAWAKINAPRQETVTFRWYAGKSLFDSRSLQVAGTGYRVHVAKNYSSEYSGKNEVRLYNSHGRLIGRRVFYIR